MSAMSASSSSSGSGSGSTVGTTKIPLTRQRVVTLLEPDGSPRRMLQAANASVSSSRVVPLVNYNSVIYFATIQIDTSRFTVLVDTGSSDLWLSCAHVAGVSCGATCPSRAVVITYGSGDVCIQGALATVQIGDVAVRNYVVGIAQGKNVLPTSSTNLLPGTAQGLLGLGYRAIAAIPTPGGQFIDYITSFSIFLTDDAFSSGSFLLLNGVDTDLIARNKLRAYTIPLQERAHWTIGMTAFQVGSATSVYPCSGSTGSTSTTNRARATPGCRSIVDTGTSLLSMPITLFNAFVATHLIPRGCFLPSTDSSSDSTAGTSNSDSTASVYICPKTASLPRLAFTFGNATFYLEGSEYLLPIARTEYAVVELQATGTTSSLANTWIIGDTFLKKFYSAYTTNTSVTFYCASDTCTEGPVATTAFPTPGSLGGTSGDNSGDTNGGGGSSGTTSNNGDGDGKLSSTTVILIVAGAVLGLALLLAAVVLLRRWQRARRDRQAADANTMNSPAAPGSAFYAGDAPLSPIGPRV